MVCRSIFFRFYQSLSYGSQMVYNRFGNAPGVPRDVFDAITSFPTTFIGFLNPPKSFTKSTFFENMLISSWKSWFSCRVGNFFTSQYGTYECVRGVLNTLGDYLKLLGPNFWYRPSFWKNLIFSTSIPSNSSNSLQNPYRLS